VGWYFLYFVLALGISGLVYRFIEEPSRRKLRGSPSRPELAGSPAVALS
jgi:peptidoglycan/LPS O-acetylase OafA/YrhL